MCYDVDVEKVVFLSVFSKYEKTKTTGFVIEDVIDFSNLINRKMLETNKHEFCINVDYSTVREFVSNTYDFYYDSKKIIVRRDKAYIDFYIKQSIPSKLIEMMKGEALI